MSEAPRLYQLPNGDLHRGMADFSHLSNVEVEQLESTDPMNRAMAAVLAAAKGSRALPCLWCGQTFDGALPEKNIREHLEKNHPSVVGKQVDAPVIMAALAAEQEKSSKK